MHELVLTLVKIVLVLLAFTTPSGCGIELVPKATEETTLA